MPPRTKEPTLEETLIQLRDATERFSTLHETQIAQLKMWAQCSKPYFNDFKIRVDLKLRELDYDVKDSLEIDENLKTKLKLMTNTIKWMLGNDFVVRFNFENGIDHENPRNTRRNTKTTKPKRKRRTTKLARRR